MQWVKRFVTDIIGAHADGWRFATALPLLFAAIVALEFVQHIVEVRIGFFDSKAAAKAVAQDNSRMILGWAKMMMVYGGGFVVIRYLVWKDAARALAISRVSVTRYAPYFLYALTLFALIFYAGAIVAADQVKTFRIVIGLTQIAVEPLLILWIVSAATDGAIDGPMQSIRRTGWLYFWGLAVFFIGRVPISAAHQLLNTYAIGQPPAILWTMLAVDAVVVGLMVAIIPALYVRIAGFIDSSGALGSAWAGPGSIRASNRPF